MTSGGCFGGRVWQSGAVITRAVCFCVGVVYTKGKAAFSAFSNTSYPGTCKRCKARLRGTGVALNTLSRPAAVREDAGLLGVAKAASVTVYVLPVTGSLENEPWSAWSTA